ncbi:alpha/beta fold hydrolase [Pseudoduganella sp. FT26W]|uniref:Alpha/beta fold hydrolase n=1 Tax=Duganella aquatilis TaxID=2666082 RepID=A0A844D765_9BURK|nr:alpha/beta hydrolase [Duganella aquatilis]MRW83069.1 alpha/beta fold hydrolase [Duganella aquatilis]
MNYTHNSAPTQFIEADGVRYAYRRFGATSGTPVLFLSHFRAGMDNWDPLVVDGIAQHHPVILFNNAGVASSGGKPADTVAGMARHVVTFLLALGLDKVDILGFSLGGFVAQQVATDRPGMVRRLILAGTGPQGGEGMAEYMPEVTRHAIQEVPTADNFLYLFFEPTASSQAAGRAFWERRHQRQDADTPSSMEAMAAQAAAIGAWGAVPATNRYAQLKAISQPVLIANGHNDVMVPSINSFIMQQTMPNATLILYPDSGHGAIFQHNAEFVAHAHLFLAK